MVVQRGVMYTMGEQNEEVKHRILLKEHLILKIKKNCRILLCNSSFKIALLLENVRNFR